MKELFIFVAILLYNLIAYAAGYVSGIRRTCREVEKIMDDAFKEWEHDNKGAKKEDIVL